MYTFCNSYKYSFFIKKDYNFDYIYYNLKEQWVNFVVRHGTQTKAIISLTNCWLPCQANVKTITKDSLDLDSIENLKKFIL